MKNCQAGIVWDGKVATISESADLQSDAMHKLWRWFAVEWKKEDKSITRSLIWRAAAAFNRHSIINVGCD